ncbi:MAG: hypothetical protein QY325_16185 [Flavobacteriales bacterium]|jgi:hypothetical protein|nr:MAG: hypothetical protein QY325_16185 [Flavobacteriales bacterium]
MSPNDLTLVARHVMKLLVERRFEELEEASGGGGLSADDMEGAVDDIGSALVMPPENAWRELKARTVRNVPDAYELSLDLWTKGGRSGSTAELMVRLRDGRPEVVLEDIIVS